MLLTELFKTEDRQECLELINTLHSELERLGLKWDNPKELMEGLGKLGKFSERDMEDHFCLNFCEDYQRQVKVKGGRVDVVDKTNKVIWELKLSIPSRREAIKVYAQVLDYQLNKRFEGYELGVVAKSISPSAKTYLEDKGVRVLVYPDYKFVADSSSPFDSFLEECLEPSEDPNKLVPLARVLEVYNIYLAKLYPQKHKISVRKLASELETRGCELYTPTTRNERKEHGQRKCLRGFELDLSLLSGVC